VRIPRLAALARDDGRRHPERSRGICTSPGMRNAPPRTWRRWGVSNRSDPESGGDALRRVPPEPGPCTTVCRVERSVPEPARSDARHFIRSLLSITRLSHSLVALGRDLDHGLRTRPEHADGRAPARDEPAKAGVPWACDGAMEERGHEIGQYGRIVNELQPKIRKREIAPPMFA